MPFRTTEAQVRALNTETDASVDVTPFLEVANMMVSVVCLTSGYTDAQLELIERWLAAHYVAVNDPRTTFEGVGPVQESLEGKTGLGLNFTRYGQQVKRIDFFGNLAAIDNTADYVKRALKGFGVKYVGGKVVSAAGCCSSDGTTHVGTS